MPYRVEMGLGWSIVSGETGESVLDVTSEHYAGFLCDKLNMGKSIEQIRNREHPDTEYFELLRELNAAALIDD